MPKSLLLLCLLIAMPLAGQNIEYSFVAPSDYKTYNNDIVGKSGIQYIKGSYRVPLFLWHDSLCGGNIKTLTATISGKYARLHNEGYAATHTPSDILNTGAMLTYVAPISKRWSLIATAGASLNAPTHYIRLQSIALTAGTIFLYKINERLNVGIGAVVTTAYGEPVVIPTPFLAWQYHGRYSIELNVRGLPELTLAAQLSERTRLTLAPFAVERFSAVVNVDGDNKLYTQNIFKSTIGVTHRIGRHISLGAQVGYTSYRRARLQERSHKAFWHDLFDSKTRFKLAPSPTFSMSVKYHFK